MTDLWADRLSEYLDGGLEPADREAMEAHLHECAACGRTLEELRQVVARARTLEDARPANDLWPVIAARLGERPVPLMTREPRRPPLPRWLALSRRFSVSMPQAVAAAFLLMLLSGAVVWWALHAARPGAPDGGGPATLSQRSGAGSRAAAPEPAATPAVLAGYDTAHYDRAVADLEQALREHRAELDSSTVRVVEQNLAIIDRAIEQARRALASDPASPYLNGHLVAQMRLKLELLRRATAFPGARG